MYVSIVQQILPCKFCSRMALRICFQIKKSNVTIVQSFFCNISNTVKLGDKERFDKELIVVKEEQFSVTNCQFTS